MLTVLFSIDPWGTSLAELGVGCGAWLRPFHGTLLPLLSWGLSVPLIWGLGDLVAATGSSQIPRNNL